MARRVTRSKTAASNAQTALVNKSLATKSSAKSSIKSPAVVANSNLRRSKRLSGKSLDKATAESILNSPVVIKTKADSKKKTTTSTSRKFLQKNIDEQPAPKDVNMETVENISSTLKKTALSSSTSKSSAVTKTKRTTRKKAVSQTQKHNDNVDSDNSSIQQSTEQKNEDIKTKQDTLVTTNKNDPFKVPTLPAPKTKPKRQKKQTNPLNELNNFMKDILSLESNLNKCTATIPVYSNEAKENIAAALGSPTPFVAPEAPVTTVRIDVFKLITETLKQTEEFKFTEKFAIYENYLSKSISAKSSVARIEDPVLRLEIMYVQLMLDYINSVDCEDDEDAEPRQVGLQSALYQQVLFLEQTQNGNNKSLGPNELFPAFYFAIRRLVEVFQGWESFSWLSENENVDENVEDEYLFESRISRLLRRLDDVWCSVLNTTQQMLQRSSNMNAVNLPLNDSIAYTTGTAFIFVVLVAKCYQNAVYYDRLESTLDDQINRKHSWKVVNQFGKVICKLFDGSNVVQEVTSLFYPLLIHQQNGSLVLTLKDVITLISQLSEMNGETNNHYQCAYFQMALTAMHYHLVWEQLKKNNALKSSEDFLEPFTTFDFITSWQSVYEYLLNSHSISFSKVNSAEDTWNTLKPNWVMVLLVLLSTIARKFIYSELVNRSKSEFSSLRYIFKYFNRILGKNQFMGHTIVASFEQMLG